MLKRLIRTTLTPILKHIPTHWRWLYPFYLTSQLQFREEACHSARLPSAFDGLHLLYASDIHYGNYLGDERALALYQKLCSLETDLILLGGDYGEDARWAEAFFDLIPPFPEEITVLAAIGNHDRDGQGDSPLRLMQKMRAKNVQPLCNAVWTLEREGRRLAFCATDDLLTGEPDFRPLIEQTVDSDFVVFMPHSPDLIPEARQAGFRFDLAICGHTHAGQVALFGRSLISSSRYKDRYRKGWVKESGADIFISSGVGVSVLPVRLGTRPEIHRLTLFQGEQP